METKHKGATWHKTLPSGRKVMMTVEGADWHIERPDGVYFMQASPDIPPDRDLGTFIGMVKLQSFRGFEHSDE